MIKRVHHPSLVLVLALLVLAPTAVHGYVSVEFLHEQEFAGSATFCFFIDPGQSIGDSPQYFPLYFAAPTSGELVLDGGVIAAWVNDRSPGSYIHVRLGPGLHSVTLNITQPAAQLDERPETGATGLADRHCAGGVRPVKAKKKLVEAALPLKGIDEASARKAPQSQQGGLFD